jgi:dephospho-CoA kinase
MAPRPALRIGLTGGIGSGKSTVAAMLAAHGAAIIDTDAIARELTLAGGAAIAAIRASFGDAFIDPSGAMDRERMRELAVRDPAARVRLEAILHPMIGAETARRAAQSAAPVRIFDVPLLVESQRWRALVDRVLVVDCSGATQASRVALRPGWTLEMAHKVIAQQATREARRACADAVICNDGIPLAQLQAEVDTLWALWCIGAQRGVSMEQSRPE